ncbi:importin-4, putative [Entamoeba invadens IP1]|uniref:Importin-4, putative n=1 Tax=Entamoeba invadens IP1 TaxID=370355 RepID=A0A0A1U2U6_ENTIV|nr:importin-4, putative [Entamoeba invadens IP1]ELP88377.1 importin-4, putative [Entamoeba invadens IP1]|eukprot:XP_004255148.1 importin-4, putative [Entamoeba invadens IP1]
MTQGISPQYIEQIVSNLLVGNNEIISKATEAIIPLLQNPEIVSPLMTIFLNHQRIDVRQMAGVLLRKKICRLWSRVNPDVQQQIENVLIQIVNTETNRVIVLTACQIIGAIANVTVQKGTWQNLLQVVLQWAQSTSELQKEVAYCLITDIASLYLDNNLNSQVMNGFFQLVGSALSTNTSLKIRIYAIKILDILHNYIQSPSELAPYEQLMPMILNTIKEAVQKDQEQEFSDIMAIMDDLVKGFSDIPEFDAATQRITTPVANLALEITKTKTVSSSIRQCALFFLNFFVTTQLAYCISSGFIPTFLQLILQILSEYNPMDPNDEESPHRVFASEVLEVLAELIPSQDFFPLFWQTLLPMLQVNDTGVACSVLLALGAVSSSCYSSLDSCEEVLMPYLIAQLQNPDSTVRSADLVCLGKLGTFYVNFLLDNPDKFIPPLLRSTVDPSNEIKASAFFDIHLILEKADVELLKPLSADILTCCLTCATTTTEFEVRDVAVSALSSIVYIFSELVVPNSATLLQIAQTMIATNVTNEIDILQKGRGIELLSCLAKSIGKDAFKPYLNGTLTIIKQMLGIEHAFEFEIRQYAYMALVDLFGVYGSELSPLIPSLMERVINSINCEDDVVEEKNNLEISSEDEDGVMENDEDDDDHVSLYGGVLIEKIASFTLVAKMFECVPLETEPYAQQIFDLLKGHCSDEREEVAEAAVEALWSVLYVPLAKERLYIPLGVNNTTENVVRLINEKSPAKVHLNLAQYPQSVVSVFNEIIKTYLSVCDMSIERDVVVMALTKIIDMFTLLGRAAVMSCADPLSKLISSILTQGIQCQQLNTGMDASEIHETEVDLITTASDVIMVLFKMFGASMVNYFIQLFPILLGIIKKRNSSVTKAACVGIIADFYNYVKVCPDTLVEPSFSLFLECFTKKGSDISRNAVYGFGMLVKVVPPSMRQIAINASQQALQIIASLLPTCKNKAFIDNYVSCVCNILNMEGSPFLPQAILPQLLAFLPVVGDHEEEMNIYSTFAKFYGSVPELNAQKGMLVDVFRRAITVNGIYPATVSFLQQLTM